MLHGQDRMQDPEHNISPRGYFAGRYLLLEQAGQGSMATVWRAAMRWAHGLFRQVAVKQILPDLTARTKFVSLFVEEARIGSQLQHPNLVQVLDFGREQGCHYMVMEWVDGLDLGSWVEAHRAQGRATPWPLVTAVGVEALRGLGAAHGRLDHEGRPAPVVHRDVTPQNILVGSNGVVKVTDFGLSRARDRSRITVPNTVRGKPGYIAPEVAWCQNASAQSDIFCLGIVLWEALAGRRLYQGDSAVEVFQATRKAEIPDLRDYRVDLPEELREVLECALASDPAQRFANAQEMLRAMTPILRKEGEPTDAQVLARSVVKVRESLGLPPTSPLPEQLLHETGEPPATPRHPG